MDTDKLSSKLGRKGDPRMHRSVAARLANPDLTLFEALKMGGFDYPTNDDASVTDSEKVTLGQRKNQLSRRLRMVRKSRNSGGGSLDGHMNNAMGGMSNGSGTGHTGGGGAGRTSNASSGGLSSEAQKELQKLMQHSRHAKISSGSGAQKRELSGLDDDDIDPDTATMEIPDDTQKRARMAKFHPDYAPLFVPPSASARNAFAGAGTAPNSNFQQQQSQQGNPLSNSMAGGMPGLSMGAASFGGGPGAMGPNGGYPGAPSLFSQQASMLSASGSGAGRPPSGVAIASLSATAQAVGLTLEQLAVSLGSSPSKLAKVLTDLNSNSADSTAKQLQVALHLYQSESRALYSKCMLLAGIHPNHCQESSQNHLQFALNAWQLEGKRLQDLLGSSQGSRSTLNMPMSFDQIDSVTTGGDNNKKGTTSKNSSTKRGSSEREGSEGGSNQDHEDNGHEHAHHSHSHGHSHSKNGSDTSGTDDEEGNCDRRHVHRLEGKCGHKAILHQPKDGSAHIDFVVGSKVECYHGIEPVGKDSDSAWPSKYRCEDLEGCSNCCAPNGSGENVSYNIEPKTIHLSEIDLADPEWNMDVNGDGSLARLFKLGE